MSQAAAALFTVAVFKDVEWARRGVQALTDAGFAPDTLTLLARESEAAAALMGSLPGPGPESLDVAALGPMAAKGPLLGVLQGADRGLSRLGLGAVIGRAGFLQHDGYIFEALVARGGCLVAILSEPRAADALAKLHAYGGGNAAIGAWTGRV